MTDRAVPAVVRAKAEAAGAADWLGTLPELVAALHEWYALQAPGGGFKLEVVKCRFHSTRAGRILDGHHEAVHPVGARGTRAALG